MDESNEPNKNESNRIMTHEERILLINKPITINCITNHKAYGSKRSVSFHESQWSTRSTTPIGPPRQNNI